MKKRILSIITILGIGVSFCSADSCTVKENYSNNSQLNQRVGVTFSYDNTQDYFISSFSFYTPSELNFTQGIKFCYFNGFPNYAGYLAFSDLFNPSAGIFSANCSSVSYSSSFSNGIQNITLLTPYTLVSGYDYFYIVGLTSNNPGVPGFYDSSLGNPVSFDDYFSLVRYTSEKSLVLSSFCYSTSNSNPVFKVNYGNTSVEFELTSGLGIHLKSPVIQNGNTFSYNGKTGLNLFYNNTSQRYNKSKLYLDSMYWFNKGVFTPICL